MVDFNDIRKASIYTDKWLAKRQAKHIKMVENSVKKLQDNIIDLLSKIQTDKTGRIEGLKVNLKQAQKVHREIEKLFSKDFSADMKKVVNDFSYVSSAIKNSYAYLDIATKFTSIDKKAMDVLRDGYYQNYLALGNSQKNKIIQSVYDQVIANAPYSQLIESIEGAVVGKKSVVGTPLSTYAKTYANDFIMNFHNEVNLSKAKTAKLTHFLYVGNIIKDSRDFCISRAGKYYTADEINSWNFRWQGKSGPAMTNRGGYNCRHHWQAIKPAWMKGATQIEVQNWFTE